MNRKREQAELLFQLGQLVGPIMKVAEDPDSYDSDERKRILARYFHDEPAFVQAFDRFTRGESGHHYRAEMSRVCNQTANFASLVTRSDEEQLYQHIRDLHKALFELVYSIPIPAESCIQAAYTPFSTYCLVKNLCSTCITQIVWMDRYFDQTIFCRYFVDTPTSVQITLVTWPDTKCKGKRDQQRYSEFIDISRLFAQERGLQSYRLITSEDFHDRWLRCDDKLFLLGGSIKDLGKDATFTISKLDSTPENIQHFDDAVNSGIEVSEPTSEL